MNGNDYTAFLALITQTLRSKNGVDASDVDTTLGQRFYVDNTVCGRRELYQLNVNNFGNKPFFVGYTTTFPGVCLDIITSAHIIHIHGRSHRLE